MGWADAKEVADKQRGGNYIKLEDDEDKMVVAFLGEPEAKEIHWIDGGTTLCDGAGCKDCKKHGQPQAKFSINVFVKTHSTYTKRGYNDEEIEEVKVFEQGAFWFNQLMECKEKYGLDKWWFEIKRKGKAKSTKTRYTILPEVKLTSDDKSLLDKVELIDLINTVRDDDDDDDDDDDKKETKQDKPKASSKKSDSFIDSDEASTITTRLKMRPREELMEFLKEFGIKRIKDIKEDKLKDAIAYIDKLEGKSKDEDEDEVDPFA